MSAELSGLFGDKRVFVGESRLTVDSSWAVDKIICQQRMALLAHASYFGIFAGDGWKEHMCPAEGGEK